MDRKSASLAEGALDGDVAAVSLGDVFDNCQAQTGAAQIAASGFINAIKPFKQAGQVFLGNTHTLILFDPDTARQVVNFLKTGRFMLQEEEEEIEDVDLLP